MLLHMQIILIAVNRLIASYSYSCCPSQQMRRISAFITVLYYKYYLLHLVHERSWNIIEVRKKTNLTSLFWRSWPILNQVCPLNKKSPALSTYSYVITNNICVHYTDMLYVVVLVELAHFIYSSTTFLVLSSRCFVYFTKHFLVVGVWQSLFYYK